MPQKEHWARSQGQQHQGQGGLGILESHRRTNTRSRPLLSFYYARPCRVLHEYSFVRSLPMPCEGYLSLRRTQPRLTGWSVQSWGRIRWAGQLQIFAFTSPSAGLLCKWGPRGPERKCLAPAHTVEQSRALILPTSPRDPGLPDHLKANGDSSA